MKKPTIGQVLATKDGQKFLVEDVFSTYEPDFEESDPEGFCVQLAPVKGLHAVNDGEGRDLLDGEFQLWCERNGVSY